MLLDPTLYIRLGLEAQQLLRFWHPERVLQVDLLIPIFLRRGQLLDLHVCLRPHDFAIPVAWLTRWLWLDVVLLDLLIPWLDDACPLL